METENVEHIGKLKHIQHELIEAKQYSKLDNLVITGGVPAIFSEVADASGATSTRMESNDAFVTKIIELCQTHLNPKFSKEIFGCSLSARKKT